jgi:hypothetical protein
MFKKTLRYLRNFLTHAGSAAAGRGRKRKRPLSLVLEPLEERVLLTVNSFINPSGGAWEDAANWSLGAVPGPSDDVAINLSGNVTVQLATANASVNSLQVVNTLQLEGGSLAVQQGAQVQGRLSVEAGSFSASGGLTVTGGTLDFDGGSLNATTVLTNATLNLGSGGTGAASFVAHGGCTLNGNLAAGQSLAVQGCDAAGTATLTWASGWTNAGTVTLQSADHWYVDSNLVVAGGVLTNAPGGDIEALAGSGGGRRLTGSLANQGLLHIGSGVGFVVAGGATAPALAQQAGSVQVDSGAWLEQYGGSFTFTGGAVSGPGEFALDNVQVSVAATVTAAARIELRGPQNTLLGNASSAVTLDLQGDNWEGDAILTTAAGAVNAGTIQLDSMGSWGNAGLVAGGSPFTNLATGVLDVERDNGTSRFFTGSFINQGLLHVGAGVQLVLNGTAPSLAQQAGTIQIDTGSWAELFGGSFDFTGGAITGAGQFAVDNSTLAVAASVTAPSVVGLRGPGSVLLDNASSAVTLSLLGNQWDGDAVLTAAQGASNAGTIVLDSTSAWGNAGLVVGGSAFTNLATGVIDVRVGNGSRRSITGAVVNEGLLHTEYGVGLVLAGGAAPASFTQQSGAVQVDAGSWVEQYGGTFDFTGGAVNGPGEFALDGVAVSVAATVTTAAVIELRGPQNTLVGNAASAVTLDLQGDNWEGDAILTTAEGAVNAGTIELDSMGSSGNAEIVVGGSSFTNETTGVIDVWRDNGTARSLSGPLVNQGLLYAGASVQVTGPLRNEGTIQVVAGWQMTVTGAGTILTQAGGNIAVGGTVQLIGGEFDSSAARLPAPATSR